MLVKNRFLEMQEANNIITIYIYLKPFSLTI